MSREWSRGESVFEREIFGGYYQSHAKFLRALLDIIREEKFPCAINEIPCDERYPDNSKLSAFLIDAERVESILVAADEEIRRQSDN